MCPVGLMLAMQGTREGQMSGLVGQVLLAAFEKRFFTETRVSKIRYSQQTER